MGMSSWSRSVYGVELDNGKNLEKIKEFLLKRINFADPEELNTVKEAEDLYDLADALDETCVAGVIANLINKELKTSIVEGFNACGDTDVDEHIGIGQWYPWAIPEQDLELFKTKESADEILASYYKELGITEEPDYFVLEYFG